MKPNTGSTIGKRPRSGTIRATLPNKENKLIDLSKVSYVIMGIDSILVVDYTDLGLKSKPEKRLLSYVSRTNHLELFKDMGNYYLKDIASDAWINVQTEGKRVNDLRNKVILRYFDVPPVRQRIYSYTSGTFTEAFNAFKYYEYYLDQKPIEFTSSHEIAKADEKEEISGYAKINSVIDTLWNLSFYDKYDRIMFNATYSDIFPFKKVGKTIEYFGNGRVKSITNFKKDKQTGIAKTFHSNGAISSLCHLSYNGKITLYDSLYTSDGELIPLDKFMKQTVFDSVNARLLTNNFKSNKLLSTHYVSEQFKKSVYLRAKRFAKFRTVKDLDYPLSALEAKVVGSVYIKVIVDEFGNIVDMQIIGKPNPILKSAAVDYLSDASNYEMFPAYADKKAVMSEFVLTCNFSISGDRGVIHRSMYWHNNFMFHNNFMMQQHMIHQNVIQNISVPSF